MWLEKKLSYFLNQWGKIKNALDYLKMYRNKPENNAFLLYSWKVDILEKTRFSQDSDDY